MSEQRPSARSAGDAVTLGAIVPEPGPEEAAAIAAAIQVAAFSGGAVVEPPQRSRWRFSGRWWSRPVPARRARPLG